MICKFCGCTDDRPCNLLVAERRKSLVAGDVHFARYISCSWFADKICTNPNCLAKAHIAITAQGEIVEMVYPYPRRAA